MAALPSVSALVETSQHHHGKGDHSPSVGRLSTAGPEPEQDPGSKVARSKQRRHTSLILRLANPQETPLRLKFAQEQEPDLAHPSSKRSVTGVLASGGEQEQGIQGSGAQVSPMFSKASAEAPASATVDVTIRPKPLQQSAGGDEWVVLEGKEDEVFRQPSGNRHRLPEAALGVVASSTEKSDGEGTDEQLKAEDNNSRIGRFALHQQGDVAWVQLPLDVSSVTTIAKAVGTSPNVVVTVRFLLVMGEGEAGVGPGGEVQVPVSVRFPLSPRLS